MKKAHLLLLFCLLLVGGCRLGNRIDTHELELVKANRHDTKVNAWIFADLKGDEADYLISTDTQFPKIHSMYVLDLKGKVISQTTLANVIRNHYVLQDSATNDRWLFYSYNDEQRIYLDAIKYTWQVPLQRETKKFESLNRSDYGMGRPDYEYFGQLAPVILADIDADGKKDLLCKAVDGFTANPRGLILFDFESGKIKWRYDMPCNPNSVLWDDFDGNGSKELVISNSAFKNTSKVINGLDDAGGWVIVLSTSGEELDKQNLFKSYGQVHLNSIDQDQDGKIEIYAVNSTWGSENNHNAVSVFSWNGSKLVVNKTFKFSSTLERYQNPEYLQQMCCTHENYLFLVDKTLGLLVLDEDLNLVNHSYKAFVKQIWQIGDLDGDGNKELILQTDDDYLEVIDSKYHRRTRLKNPFPEEAVFGIKIVRTGFENKPYVAIGSGREIRYYQYKHLPLFTLVYNAGKHNIGYLTLLLLLIIPLQYYHGRQRMKVSFIFANTLGEAMIVVSGADKIIFRNLKAMHMLENSPSPECKRLSLCCPKVYSAILTQIRSKIKQNTIVSSLGFEGNDTKYQINIMKLSVLRSRYLIGLYPLDNDSDATADKMQWADIARRLSHHVRRHITNIILCLEALSSDKDAGRLEYYQIIKDEIEKVRVFTHAFQRFTELKDYDLKLQDIVPSIEHCLSRVKLAENVHLIKSWNLQSFSAFIEPIRFEEAMLNTVNNALEAMPEGGTLHVTIKEFPVKASPQGQLRVLVEIEDSGKGIPAKYLEDIWKPFFTTNQSGTGIGIPETKKIIDSMGGLMDIHSEEGVGTVVSFWLKGSPDG